MLVPALLANLESGVSPNVRSRTVRSRISASALCHSRHYRTMTLVAVTPDRACASLLYQYNIA